MGYCADLGEHARAGRYSERGAPGPPLCSPSGGASCRPLAPGVGSRPAMKLRSHLLLLSLPTPLPMAIFSVGGAFLLAERERHAFERGAIERVRALMTAVDADLRGSITTLQALAVLPVFESDDP